MPTSLSAAPAPATHGFSAFGLRDELERAIEAVGYTQPRPIQAQTIPAVLEGRDVLGLAQTGTGKTAAFALPILDRLLRDPGLGPRALVVAPTRELATQIDADFRSLARFTKIRTVTLFGGVSDRGQIRELARRPQVVVACPGRLLDLHGQGALRFDRIETLVLDEADHMFDMGFLPDIRRVLAALPKDRQNLLFSATMPTEIRGLAHQTLSDPLVVELAHKKPLSTIEHALYPVVEKRKRELLERLIRSEGVVSALVFTRTKHRARKLARDLERAGHRAIALQGNMSQNARDRAMGGFRSGRFDILVATDIVARGIDVEQISHVFNFDVPNTPEAYTHRIGRTGRAERNGKAYTFVTVDDHAIVRAIERQLDGAIPRSHVEGFEQVTLPSYGDRPARRAGSRSPNRREDFGQRPSRRQSSNGGARRGGSQFSQASRSRSSEGDRPRGEQDSTKRGGAPRRRRRPPSEGYGERSRERKQRGRNPGGPPEQSRSARKDGDPRERRSARDASKRASTEEVQGAESRERRGGENSNGRFRRRRRRGPRRRS